MLRKEDKKFFLDYVRTNIEAALDDNLVHKLVKYDDNKPESAHHKQGAFVTLHTKEGALRGCIGTFEETRPLIDVLKDMSIAAAFEDPRFPSVESIEELKNLKIEISVLSKRVEIKHPKDIIIGKHGLYISENKTWPYRSGVLLPQVATEYEWTVAEFLTHTCLKARLGEHDWINPANENGDFPNSLKVEIFSAEVFSE